jgi:hypothetical protein
MMKCGGEGTMMFLVVVSMMFVVTTNSIKYGLHTKNPTPGGVQGYKKLMPVDWPLGHSRQ